MRSERSFRSTVARHLWQLASVFIVLVAVNSAFAQETIQIDPTNAVLFTDFDNTITGEENGAWVTYWYLQLVPDLTNALQATVIDGDSEYSFTQLPQEIALTYEEFIHFSSMQTLAVDEGHGRYTVNELRPHELKAIKGSKVKRPASFFPGYYYPSDAQTFRDYRPNIGGESHLLTDYKLARANQKATKLSWQGKGFPLFKLFMDSGNGNKVIIHTNRGQSPQEFLQLFELMKADGEISQTNPDIRIFPMHSEHGIDFGNTYLRPRKVDALRKVASDYVKFAKGQKKRIQLIVSDDEPGNIQALGEEMIELSNSRDYTQWIDFILVNTGSTEWRKPGDKRDATFKHRVGVIRNGLYSKVLLEAAPESAGACKGVVK